MSDHHLTRRGILGSGIALTALQKTAVYAGPSSETAPSSAPGAVEKVDVRLTVNGIGHQLKLDPRTTLLDALREHLDLTGTKKGCDHGQCGACTVLMDGERRNACLNLALACDDREITTIEGLGTAEQLHPVQAAFIKHDGFQCGYCTPGQICSTVGMLNEIERGIPSAASADLRTAIELTESEVRERMSGNICRCAAYPNIAAAILEAAGKTSG
ncbi:2Fe-2S iron-sulfur cluster-binding protein [Enhydrobacter aerosaccus]|nr:2Fe-2S iron-sulfur cluster-binding protein [Enhydrobacter aerosaccus]